MWWRWNKLWRQGYGFGAEQYSTLAGFHTIGLDASHGSSSDRATGDVASRLLPVIGSVSGLCKWLSFLLPQQSSRLTTSVDAGADMRSLDGVTVNEIKMASAPTAAVAKLKQEQQFFSIAKARHTAADTWVNADHEIIAIRTTADPGTKPNKHSPKSGREGSPNGAHLRPIRPSSRWLHPFTPSFTVDYSDVSWPEALCNRGPACRSCPDCIRNSTRIQYPGGWRAILVNQGILRSRRESTIREPRCCVSRTQTYHLRISVGRTLNAPLTVASLLNTGLSTDSANMSSISSEWYKQFKPTT